MPRVYGYFTPPELRRPGAMQVHAVLRIALAVSFAALGAAEPYFNCPKGAYLSYKRRAIATLDLARCAKRTLPIRPQLVHPPAHHRRQQREAISAGWQPHGTKDPNYGHTYERTGTSTWCSFNWARPNKCQHDSKPAMMPDEIWHQTLPSGMPGQPVRSVFNNKIEFIHNYKAASSAVAAFLSCAYGREVDSSVFEASVFVVRDPIDRFISGVGEMLRRYVRSSTPRPPCSNRHLPMTRTTSLGAGQRPLPSRSKWARAVLAQHHEAGLHGHVLPRDGFQGQAQGDARRGNEVYALVATGKIQGRRRWRPHGAFDCLHRRHPVLPLLLRHGPF